MKNLIIASLFLSATASYADSSKLTVAPFKGELVASKGNLKVSSIVVSARIQHCNFWGSTCAGGPAEEVKENLLVKQDTASNLVAFELKKGLALKSSKIGKRFSSCNLNLSIFASDETGARFEGYIGLVHENDKAKCESAEEIKNIVAEKLKVPVRVNFWGLSR